jgi:hypothetical protein
MSGEEASCRKERRCSTQARWRANGGVGYRTGNNPERRVEAQLSGPLVVISALSSSSLQCPRSAIWPHYATRSKKPHVALPVARGLSQSFGAPHRYRSTPTCSRANSSRGESRLLERVPCSSIRLIRLIRLVQWLMGGGTDTTFGGFPPKWDVICCSSIISTRRDRDRHRVSDAKLSCR